MSKPALSERRKANDRDSSTSHGNGFSRWTVWRSFQRLKQSTDEELSKMCDLFCESGYQRPKNFSEPESSTENAKRNEEITFEIVDFMMEAENFENTLLSSSTDNEKEKQQLNDPQFNKAYNPFADEEDNEMSDDINLESIEDDNELDPEERDDDDETMSRDIPFGADLIYDSAPITVFQSILLVFVLAMRHSLTKSCMTDILKMIELHCIRPNKCVKSIYQCKKLLSMLRHWKKISFCTLCSSMLTESQISHCTVCDAKLELNNNFFTVLDPEEQVKTILVRPGILNIFKKNTGKGSDPPVTISDITDGEVYKQVLRECKDFENYLTLFWFTDGVQLFQSSKTAIWPLYFAINELPFTLRFKKENLILAAIWIGKCKPHMNSLFRLCESFLEHLKSGIVITVNGLELKVKGQLLGGSADLPAKCQCLNMIQFNGLYGCASCLQPGESFRLVKGQVHIYPFKEDLCDQPLRTHEDTMKHAFTAAAQKGQTEKTNTFGIKGPCQLAIYVTDIINSTALDYMHGVCLGVKKKLLQLLFETKHMKHDFSLYKSRFDVENLILNIKVPHYFQRSPRPLKMLSDWKASEFQKFLLYYSVPLFFEVMQKNFLEHHMLLVSAMSILLSEKISDSSLNKAKHSLFQYVYLFEKLYGKRHMTANIHNLLHLADSVSNLGPLWATSCFGWENINGLLIKAVHGTQHVPTQIAAAVTLWISLPDWIEQCNKPEIKQFCELALKKNRYKVTRKLAQNMFIIGRETLLSDPTLMNEIKLTFGELCSDRTTVFHRILVKNSLYTSVTYSEKYKKASCYIKYDAGPNNYCSLQFGSIEFFVNFKPRTCECLIEKTECLCNNSTEHTYCYIGRFQQLPKLCTFDLDFNVTLQHITQVQSLKPIAHEFIPIGNIIVSCTIIATKSANYIVEPVNTLEFE